MKLTINKADGTKDVISVKSIVIEDETLVEDPSNEELPVEQPPEEEPPVEDPPSEDPTDSQPDPEPTPSPTPTPTPVPSPTPSPTKMALGMNVEPLSFWDVGLPFVDHMKMCGAGGTPTEPWCSVNRTTFTWNDGQPVAMDANGYVKSLQPNQIVVTLTKSGFGGIFVLSWDGTGEFQVDGVGSSNSGKLRFSKPPGVEIKITLRQVDPTNYPKNIRLTLDKFEKTNDVFYPEYLDKLKDFSCLRFMDWMTTNNSQRKNVQDLKTKTFMSQVGGASLDYIAELCNKLGKDCWINVPHLATDAMIEEMALQMSLKLNNTLKLYVEFSNECWNGMFAQTAYVQQQAGLAGIGSDYDAGQKWYGRRARQVMEIFEKYFAPNEMIRVFAHQNGNQYHTTMALNFEQNKSHFDALAIAPYFGRPIRLTEQTALQQQGKQFVLGMCPSQITENVNYAKDSKITADQFGLKLITYEGGQHWLASPEIHNNQQNLQIIMDAQRDSSMKTFYLDYLQKLEQAGIVLFNHFTFVESFGKWSMFGCLESLLKDRVSSPKWDALLTFLGK